jgi:hypothetical protein
MQKMNAKWRIKERKKKEDEEKRKLKEGEK